MSTNKIDALVSLAASTATNDDYERLFSALEGVELFFNVTATSGAGKPGAGMTPISTPLVDAGPGLKAILFFTSNDNVNLKKPYAGITWKRALEMVLKMPQADGLIIQNINSSWVGIDKKKAKYLLDSDRM